MSVKFATFCNSAQKTETHCVYHWNGMTFVSSVRSSLHNHVPHYWFATFFGFHSARRPSVTTVALNYYNMINVIKSNLCNTYKLHNSCNSSTQ